MKTVSARIISFFLVFAVVFGIVSAVPNAVYAAGYESFDKTYVVDDLKSSTADQRPFDITEFPYDENGDIQIINVVEYCYSYKANLRDNYALYLYIYNPQAKNISRTGGSNKVQMAVEYDVNGNPSRYEKFELQCVSVSVDSYKNLFYKFKVIDHEVNGTTFDRRVNSIERRYDISGIELLTVGDKNATEYGLGGTYFFSGFAKGLGEDTNAESTLKCTVENLETLSLEVKHTNFRTNVSSLGKDHYNEVNTAYFAVPERIFDQYGNLQKIHAEWWEYKTKLAAVTANEQFYNELLDYVGVDVGEYNSSVPVSMYSYHTTSGGLGIGNPLIHNYEWTYNVDLSTTYSAIGTPTTISYSNKVSSMMPYAFLSPASDIDSIFKFLYTEPVAGSVEDTVVKDWIYTYSNSLGHGYIDCNGRKISRDLFEGTVDEGRIRGYNNVNIDLEDTFDLNSYDSNHSWWDKLWDYGFSWPSTNGDYKDIQPIYVLQKSDLYGSAESIAEKLLINEDDVSELKTYFDAQTKDNKKVVLFRFANTDYYCAPALHSGTQINNEVDTYVAQQTIFFDFDIIDLTFNKDGVYRVIPVVSSPIDIINGFDPPAVEFEWWKIALAILLLILLIYLLYPVLPYIVQALLWILQLPIRIINFIRLAKPPPIKKPPKQDKNIYKDYTYEDDSSDDEEG